ncbi:endolytic transglycosylase MltG [Parasediminibacterium paludis]|uniref:Endolytic murein transglycosylase n=1 Tax=Parasediminibacterium paludis TaxID=908966 RepID=A0ABV8Q106_9BACT
MKRFLTFLLLIIVIIGAIAAYMVLGSATNFDEKTKSFVVEDGKTDKASVIETLEKEHIINNTSMFGLLADQLDVWQRLKSGRFQLKNGDNLLTLAKILRNNRQAEVKLVINKLRTKEDFARLIAKNFSTDSLTAINYFNNNDSLRVFGVNDKTLFTIIIPNTYSFYYFTPLSKVLAKIKTASDAFWDAKDRKIKATALALSPAEVYTLASIVEEETNKEADKGNIASVYLNRYNKGMKLGADPTVRFAMNDFTIKRVYEKYLQIESPYNTYRNLGLPPGPICTPSASTIDAVLNAPKTDYLFFVADADLKGGSHFSSNYAEHLQYAKAYQQALTIYLQKKQAQGDE